MRKHKVLFIIGLGLVSLFQAGCSNKSETRALGSDVTDPNSNQYSQPTGNGSGIDLSGLANVPNAGGSNPNGSLSAADQQALQNSLNQSQQNSPTTVSQSDLLPADLQAQIDQLIRQSQQGDQTMVARLQLVGQLLQRCSQRAAPLAPLPGQPLLGVWNGGGACAVNFVVSGAGQNGIYQINGSTQGLVEADLLGGARVNANPFSGTLTDGPEAGRGTLTHPTFHRTKSGSMACTVTVNLSDPRSPIPQNYAEAMRITGQCFRQSLLLLSPAMDHINPQLQQSIMNQYIGVQP